MSRYNSTFQRRVKSLLPNSLKNKYQKLIDQKQIDAWERNGKPSPPPHIIKVRTVKKYRDLTGYSVFVESGTFMGDMIKSQLDNFDKIYSIELSETYWKRAKKTFEKNKHVNLLQGDSGEVMNLLIKDINSSAIFWLDGHYSGGDTAKGSKFCPIYEELNAIFTSIDKHCLLIDDARLFNGADDYPTLDELKGFILKNRPTANINVEADTISVLY